MSLPGREEDMRPARLSFLLAPALACFALRACGNAAGEGAVEGDGGAVDSLAQARAMDMAAAQRPDASADGAARADVQPVLAMQAGAAVEDVTPLMPLSALFRNNRVTSHYHAV